MSTPPTPPTSNRLCGQAVSIELIREILQHLGGPKRNLLNAAKSNRLFLEPALELIWAHMHSLTPFLLLLPHDTIILENSTCWILSMATLTVGNEKFTKYAKLLRSLKFEDKSPSDIVPLLSICRLCSLPRPNEEPIFPRLTNVSFTSSFISQPTAALAILALPSPITKLEFTNLQLNTTTFCTTLSFFSLQFSNSLKELTLDFPNGDRQFDMNSLQFLCRFQALETLSIACPNNQFPIFTLLPWILGLGALQDLNINVRVDLSQEQADEFRLSAVTSSSRSLLRLTLCGSIEFIRCVSPLFEPHGVNGRVVLTLSHPVGDEEALELRTETEVLFPAPTIVEVWHPID